MPTISPAQRWEVWERDDFTCQRCGARRFLSIDHIVPQSRGGSDKINNLQTLCRSCNSAKRDKMPSVKPKDVISSPKTTLYFGKEENEKLKTIAKSLGCIVKRGPHTGQGSVSKLCQAIARDEIILE